MKFSYHQLKQFVVNVLQQYQVNVEDAEIVAEGLVRADFEGVGSHGVSRLEVYTKRLADKRFNAQPSIRMKKIAPSALLVDGDNGLGHAVTLKAVNEGIHIAKEQGVSTVGIYNSNHFGTVSYYCQEAAKEGMITIACSNATASIAPWGGKQAFFGTNPIAFGFPKANGSPVIIDMSTSIIARGKIIVAAKNGEEIPADWALDKEGKPTTDPKKALEGTILPFGGVKGAAIALAVEILAAALTGATLSPNIKGLYDEKVSGPANNGHFFLFINADAYGQHVQYEHNLQLLLQLLHSSESLSDQPIRYPGERRHQLYLSNQKNGIDLSDAIISELKQVGQKVNIPFLE